MPSMPTTLPDHAECLRLGQHVQILDLLSRVGYSSILTEIGGTPVADEDSAASVESARLTDHDRVRGYLMAHDPGSWPDGDGCPWIPGRAMTWPDRVPGLKPWSGHVKLQGIIRNYQRCLALCKERNLFLAQGPLTPEAKKARGGATGSPSGIDWGTVPSGVDAGFSVANLEMSVVVRPGVELLAVIGLETLPLVSYSMRDVGVIYDGSIWRWTVEHRAGHYYRWSATAFREIA